MYKRTKSKRTVSVKAFVAILALVLALGCAAGGTFAWLTAQTTTVTNTFTYGDINITLTESKPTGNQAKIIPGVNIEKDPKVTVEANSEACYLFVKVEEASWPTFKEADGKTNKISYAIADGWNELEGHPGVYYRELGFTSANTDYAILKGNIVTVSQNLTKTEIGTIAGNKQFTLKFTAYAVQKDGIADAATAWGKIPTT